MFIALLFGMGITGVFAGESFLPPNSLHLQDDQKSLSAITESDFRGLIAEATHPWKALAQVHGAELTVESLWSSNEVNAFASRVLGGTRWKVEMHGGLARRSEVTQDGLILVVCHELGHLFGGYPFFPAGRLSFEGQADTFATQVCLKELWREQRDLNAERAAELSPEEGALCAAGTKDLAERDLCGRILRAGLSIAKLFGALEKSGRPSILTPSKKVATYTMADHPPAQCRLDTYVQGARCGVQFPLQEIPGYRSTDEGEQQAAMRRTSCALSGAGAEFARPACWFKDSHVSH